MGGVKTRPVRSPQVTNEIATNQGDLSRGCVIRHAVMNDCLPIYDTEKEETF